MYGECVTLCRQRAGERHGRLARSGGAGGVCGYDNCSRNCPTRTGLERGDKTGSDKWRMGISADRIAVRIVEETCLNGTLQ